MASSTIEERLLEIFSLDTLDQVQSAALDCTIGFCSTPNKYTVTLRDGTIKHVFVKQIDLSDDWNKLAIRNETKFYDTFLPDIRMFLREFSYDEGLVDSSFVKFYELFDTDTAQYCILQDIQEKECSMTQGRLDEFKKITVEDTVRIFKKMGALYGMFYAWRNLKYPGIDWKELCELHPALKFTERSSNGMARFSYNFITAEEGLAIVKIIKSLSEDSPVNQKLESLCNLDSLDRLMRILPDLVLLSRYLQRPTNNLWGPTFGDLHQKNLALAENTEDVVFFDFGHFQLSSVMLDFHRYTGLYPYLDVHHDQLLEAKITSFRAAAAEFGVGVSREELYAEHHRMKSYFIVWRFFVCVFVLKLEDVPGAKDMVGRVTEADITTVEGRAEVVTALDETEQGGEWTGWRVVNEVIDLINKVEGELADLEDQVANTEYSPTSVEGLGT